MAPFSFDNVIFSICDSSIAAINNHQDQHLVLVDSGACENVAKSGDFKEPVDKNGAKPLFSVQGHPLNVYGKQYPHVAVGSHEGFMEMTVTDAAESLISVHSLVQRGHQAHFTPEGCYLVMSDGENIPLELHGKRWYLRVRKLGANIGEHQRGNWVAPVAPVDKGQDEDEGVDTWSLESKDGDEYLVRVHNVRRVCLFAPDRTKDVPVDLGRILPGRLTKIVYVMDGSKEEHQGVWTQKRLATKSMKKAWIGESWFRLKPELQGDNQNGETPEDDEMKGYEPSEVEESEGKSLFQLIQQEDAQHDRQMEELARKHQVDDGGDPPPAQEAATPYEPTEAEKQLHRLHHANFEPWCETCVQGQGRTKSRTRELQKIPRITSCTQTICFSPRRVSKFRKTPKRRD